MTPSEQQIEEARKVALECAKKALGMECGCYADAWPAASCATADATVAAALSELIAPTLASAHAVGMREARQEVSFAALRVANETRQKEWDWNDKITLGYRGCELGGEVGEALNIIKKLERERLEIRGSRATVRQLAEELADVIICADLCAMMAGVDLAAAVRDKFNATSEKYGLQSRFDGRVSRATVLPLAESEKGEGND